MPGSLPQYLKNKAEAMAQAARDYGTGDNARETISAECSAADLTGVRRIRIRDFQLISDSGPAFGGFRLGPSSPELLLGVLASCLTHTYLITAANRGIPLDEVHVRFEAENNDAGFLGLDTADPDVPFNIRAFVRIDSSAPSDQLDALHAYVEQACPLTKIVRDPHRLTIQADKTAE